MSKKENKGEGVIKEPPEAAKYQAGVNAIISQAEWNGGPVSPKEGQAK